VKTESAAHTDVGRVRAHNEDRLLVDERLGLFVVCDGMGGHAAGDVASELAAKTIAETIEHAAGPDTKSDEMTAEEATRLERVVRNALENANDRVYALGQENPDKRGAGTTCTALLVRGGRGFLAHVGDTRAYLKRGGALHQLSTDHSIVAEAVRKGMSQEEAEAMFGSNVLTRAIGPNESVVVDSLVFEVLPNDTYLLCSDGLHNYFTDPKELSALLDEPLPGLPGGLIDRANERGGGDNITAVALRIRAEDSADEEARQSRTREDLAALSHMQLFCEMSYQELLQIADAVRRESYKTDDTVLAEGETSDNLYVIASGAVRVERGTETIAELDPGCHFGEMAVLTNRPRTATVRANGPTRLLALSRRAIVALFERRPVIGMKFLWTLAQVQSVRLDEALLWRSGQSPDMVDTAETERMIPAPFSRV